MRVAIFGARGYIGGYLNARLTQSGVDVIPYSSTNENLFDIRTGILADTLEIPSGTDCVVYLAQSPHHRKMPEMAVHLWGVNVVSAMKAADKARASGAKRFIYASTGNVYFPAFHPHPEDGSLRREDWYALSKIHAEESLALYRKDMAVTIARIFGVYGPNQADRLVPNLVQSVRSSATIRLAPHPTNALDRNGLKLSLCHINDVVEIFSHLIHEPFPPDVINVAGPEILSIREIALAVGEVLGVAPRFEMLDLPRAFDLLADVTKLVKTQSPAFTPFQSGIAQTLQC